VQGPRWGSSVEAHIKQVAGPHSQVTLVRAGGSSGEDRCSPFCFFSAPTPTHPRNRPACPMLGQIFTPALILFAILDICGVVTWDTIGMIILQTCLGTGIGMSSFLLLLCRPQCLAWLLPAAADTCVRHIFGSCGCFNGYGAPGHQAQPQCVEVGPEIHPPAG